MKTLTVLLAVFVFFTLYLQSVELHSSGASKTSSTSKSKQTEKRCIDSCQCPNGTVCLPKKFGKRRKTCQTCECRLSAQCRKNPSNEIVCDCSDSGFTGMNCETPLDIDECAAGTDCCNGESHNCTNTVGSYTCACTLDTYQLGTDGCTCEASCNRLQVCPDGWETHEGNCYRQYTTKTDWFTANENCKSIGINSHLVEITSEDESKFIYVVFGNNGDIWTALNDISTEDEFRWNYSGEVFNDATGPDFVVRNITVNFDCVTWWLYALYDYDCSTKYWYICEISL